MYVKAVKSVKIAQIPVENIKGYFLPRLSANWPANKEPISEPTKTTLADILIKNYLKYK